MKKIFILLTVFLVGFSFTFKVKAQVLYPDDYYNNLFNNFWDNFDRYEFGSGDLSDQYFWHNTLDFSSPTGYNFTPNSLNYMIEYLRSISSNSSEFEDNVAVFTDWVTNNGIRINIPNNINDIYSFGIFDSSLAGSDGLNYPSPNLDYFHTYIEAQKISYIQITFEDLLNTSTFNYSSSALTTGMFNSTSATYKVYSKNRLTGNEELFLTKTILFNNINRLNVIDLGFYITPIEVYKNKIDWNSYTHDFWSTYLLDTGDYNYWNGFEYTGSYTNDDYLFQFIKKYIEPMASNDVEYKVLLNVLKYYVETEGIVIKLPSSYIYDFQFSVGGQWINVPQFEYANSLYVTVKLSNISFNNMIYGSSNGYVGAKTITLSYSGDSVSQSYAIPNAEISIRAKASTYKTITFDSNGGTNFPDLYGYTNMQFILPKTVERLNYTFLGWTIDPLYADETLATLTPEYLKKLPSSPDYDGLEEYIIIEDRTQRISETNNFYAIWFPKIYNVSFNLNGGTLIRFGKKIDYASFNVYYKTPVTQNIGGYDITQKPYRIGYTFSGYYTEPQFINKFELSTPVTQSITLHTKWVKTLNTAEEDTATRLLSSVGLNFEQGGLLLYVLLNIGLILFSLRYSSKLAWIISVLLLLGFGIFGLIKVVVVIIMGLLLITVLLFLMNKGDSSE